MLKVLIVDDEPKARRGLASLLEAKPDSYRIVASCSSGAQAGALLSTTVVDVVITDIRMPGMDGLELISRIRNRHPHIRFIILSGYGEFEYAQAAIRYQVARFLLKPVNESELYDALDQIAVDLKSGQWNESYGDSYFYILVKTASPSEQDECLAWIGLDEDIGNFYVLVYSIEYIKTGITEDHAKFHAELKSIFNRTLSEQAKIYHFFAKQLVVVLPSEEIPGEENLLAAAHELMEHFNCRTHIGVSAVACSLSQLRDRYFQAVTASQQHLYDNSAQVFYYNTEDMEPVVKAPSKLLDVLVNCIQHGRSEEISSNISELVDYYIKSRISIFRLKNQLLEFANRLSQLAQRYGLHEDEIKSLRQFITDVEEMKSYTQLEEILLHELRMLSEKIQDVAMEKSRAKIHSILEYLENNYHKNLSLNDVAEQVGISPAYLSNFFKLETGVNYIDYLTDLRIKAAKKMLSETGEKVYNIAKHLGYEDPKYFATLFKKQVGVTPGEYRRLF